MCALLHSKDIPYALCRKNTKGTCHKSQPFPNLREMSNVEPSLPCNIQDSTHRPLPRHIHTPLQDSFSIDSLAISCPDCPQGVTFKATEDGILQALSPEDLQCSKTFTVPLGENKSLLYTPCTVLNHSLKLEEMFSRSCCTRSVGMG